MGSPLGSTEENIIKTKIAIKRYLLLKKYLFNIFIIILLCITSAILVVALKSNTPYEDFINFIKDQNTIFSLAVIITIICTLFLTISSYLTYLSNRPAEFIDIDFRSRSRFAKEFATYEASKNQLKDYKSSNEYLIDIILIFEEKIYDADTKASLLLDKGTSYARRGIYFYIFSIVAWQITLTFIHFESHHIYGIIGCTLIFIFIEFLSAWFLKQYRQYVDTSIYLTKVKTFFDRCLLVYLIHKNQFEPSPPDLLELLKDDIKWPDTYLTKNPDVSFAKECMETATQLIRAVKSETKQ